MTSSLYTRRKGSFNLVEINTGVASCLQLLEISRKLGLGLSPEEMKTVQVYFNKEQRSPTDVELQTIAQTWSEHCCHKTFKGKIHFNGKEIDSLFKTFISRATEEINAPWCVSVFEDNAGIIRFNQDYGIAVKVETHNHPSAVEPFGGAATGVGGVIRDVLGVWADPIACTDVLGFGPLDFDYHKLPSGVKHPKYVYAGVVGGIGSYGNNMGIPTVNGAIYFDKSYTGNVVVFCGCIGLLPLKKFKKNAQPNHIILLAGGKTGRDGIHGVTFASAELTEESEEISRPAVQIANPIEEEKLKRAIIEIRELNLASAITDLGGGGLSSAVGETAQNYGCGATVELEKVPLKDPGLAPWEIFLSESQERMLLIIPKENLEKALETFEKEEVEATAIGKLTLEKRLKLVFHKERVADLNMQFLFKTKKSVKSASIQKTNLEEPFFPEPENITETLLQLLAAPNIASKESVIRTYDHEVKGNTTLKPLQGAYGGPNDAAVIKPLEGSNRGLTISCGMNPNYGKVDTYWMAASAIDEAIRNNLAVGGRKISLLDNFTWGNPEKPDRLGALVRACEACYDFATAFGTPFISGKDSLYNESPLGPVTPTLLITAIGIIPDIHDTVSMDVKTPDNSIYVVGQTRRELGGSEYYRLKGFLGRDVPKVYPMQTKETFRAITKAIDLGTVRACHDLSEGGLGIAAAEMAMAGDYGIELDLNLLPKEALNRNDLLLFSESNSRFLVEVSEENRRDFETSLEPSIFSKIGKVKKNKKLTVYGVDQKTIIDVRLAELRKSWKGTLSSGCEL